MWVRHVSLTAAVFVLLAVGACSRDAPRPIFIEGRVLTVQNLTHEEWRQVEVWLNTHYRVTKTTMPAGERFDVPLDAFVAGFGQRFNPARQVVQGIVVTATTAAGQPVRLSWGEGRAR